jgi:hypothetical protein
MHVATNVSRCKGTVISGSAIREQDFCLRDFGLMRTEIWVGK